MKLSDFLTRRELRRTPLYDLVLKPVGLSTRSASGFPSRRRRQHDSSWTAADATSARATVPSSTLEPPPRTAPPRQSDQTAPPRGARVARVEPAAVVLLEADLRIAYASAAATESLGRYLGENGVGLPSRWRRGSGSGAEQPPRSRSASLSATERSSSSLSTARCFSRRSSTCRGSRRASARSWISLPRAGRTPRSPKAFGYRVGP